MYKLMPKNPVTQNTEVVQKLPDNVFIPFDPLNTDYQEYLKWLDGYEKQHNPDGTINWVKTSDGNEPLPADSGE